MGKSLVIVESPAKAKTINKFLGSEYIVRPTGGHIIDLPPKEIGIDIENGFTPHYTVIKGKGKILSDLKKTAQNSDVVLLATDPDREGEAIAWHVANRIIGKNQPSFRILFNQITKDAVLEAIENRTELDLNKVNAQQARRILDRLVGYKVSPFLWKTIYSGLSAGRVQSVALRIIVERDAEIEAFVPVEYWVIRVMLATARNEEFEAKLVRHNDKAVQISNVGEAEAIVRDLSAAVYRVQDITSKESKKRPSPPFITSTLQQDAARRLGFTVSRTMSIAQSLYEGVELAEGSVGLITYMRTDSTRIAQEAINEVRDYVVQSWGREQLPDRPVIYRAGKGAQDAHEAIRPSSVLRTPASIGKYLSKEQLKLYTLIWNRFVASQMKPAVFNTVTVTIAADGYELRASASKVVFKGYLAVYDELKETKKDSDDDDTLIANLPKNLVKNEPLSLRKINPEQNFTKPPARYTEASLVRELESQRIGRPSTYAQIIYTIINREYVTRSRGKLLSTELGRNVNRILVQGFPDLFNVKFTANMEEELDKIESGEHEWLYVVKDFYRPFSEALDSMNKQHKDLKKAFIEQTDQICEKCGSPMVIRWGKKGKFMACSGFPKCKNTRPLEVEKHEVSDIVCDKCGSPMEVKSGKFGRFLACSNYPACKNIKPLSLGVKCPVEGCTGQLREKRTKRGKVFYGCSKYPVCTFATWEKPVNKVCENCGSPTLIENRNGETFTCPRCKSSFDSEQIKE